MTTLGTMGEHEVIRRLTTMLDHHPDLIVSAGDDCAVARLEGSGVDQVFTTDPVIEDVHFKSADAPVRIGNKAAGRVLSDIAAMGARPQWMLVNVVAPEGLDFSILEGVYAGMSALCRRFGATIIGGDLAQGHSLEIHVFGTGLLSSGSALLRSGAKAGDLIYVSGALGCSIKGKHLDFVPRVEEGLFLRESGVVGALMDISDGLATDLRHILEQSGVGAEIDADQVPAVGTLDEALYDGEDFELLFTVPVADAAGLCDRWLARFGDVPTCIGRITAETGTFNLCFSDGSCKPVAGKAFEHFSTRGKNG